MPTATDQHGNLNNVITVTFHLPEYDSTDPLNDEDLAGSPVESYDFSLISQEDQTTEPPTMPRLLATAPIDRKSGSYICGTDFVRLNHVFATKSDLSFNANDVRTLATEHRFKAKVITTILVTMKRKAETYSALPGQRAYATSQAQPIPTGEAPTQSLGESQSLILDALNNV